MQQAVVRVFDAFDRAQRAREALLADGFDRSDVTLSVANDEAGPVEGNFTVGNMPVESDRHTYDRNYANIQQVAQCIMTVTAADEAMAARADGLLARFGARPV
jgi:hypothetical protein